MILYVIDRNIRVDNADNQISYNLDYIAEFRFDEEWNGKVKTARFVQNKEYFDIVLVDDRCEIPPLKTGFVRVGVFSDSMTSTYADVYYKTSIKDGTGNSVDPPKDVYAQLIELIESGMLKGADGLTPYVGENNNWWIGDVDTGILARGYTPQKGVDYFTEGEVQQIQNEVSESIQANINHLEINKADKSELDKTNLSLNALWKMNRGQTWDTLESESESYSVDVPSGSHYASIDKVGGKSVVWNQLWNYEETYKESGLTYTYENHFYDVVKDTTAHNGMYVYHNFQPNNKYYVSYEASSNDNIKLTVSFGNSLTVELTESNERYRGIITTNTSRSVIYLYSPSGIACTYRVGNIKIVSLTQMFGSGKEPSTVEEFEAMCPADYYPYSEPTIISSHTDRVEVVNADSTITQQITTGFPVLNSAGSVYDYIDLNEGKLHRRVGVVDMGTLDWDTFPYGESTVFRSYDYTGKKPSGSTHKANIMCAEYKTVSASDIYQSNKDKSICVHNGAVGLMITDSAYTDITAFKTAMSGVMLYYELAEPIITDIAIPSELSDWLTVEAGGSITFHNSDEGKRLLVPNKLSFVRKLDEVSV